VTVQDLADDLRPDDCAALTCPLGGAVDQVPLERQQLRGREPLNTETAVTSNPDGPLFEEPVGRFLDLGERLLRARRDGQTLGQGVHHVRPGEGGHLSGQPVRTGQPVQGGVQLCPRRWTAPSTPADRGQLPFAHPLLRQLGRPPGMDALLGLRVVFGRPGRHRCGAGRPDPGQTVAVQPLVDLLRALGEPLNQCPVVQPLDLGRARALVHRAPADTQALGERGSLGGQIQVVGRHQLGVQPVAVQGRPASVRPLGGVLDQHVGVAVGVAGAAHAVLEGHRH
jgi:hypothetical protein